jgi:nitrate/TMAO reductase-like tetraheme cytochrome c subunit
MIYKKIFNVILVIFLLLTFSLNMVIAEEAKYKGLKRCKMCHIKQFKTWKKSPKANTFSKLKKKATDKKCLKCHATLDKKGNIVDKNVTCEACHGPGSKHMKTRGLKKRPKGKKNIIAKPTNCTSCHIMHKPHIERR